MKQFTGILLIVISAAAFGTLVIFGKLLYAEGLDLFTMLFLRFSLAALVMAVILVLRREPFPRGKILLQLIGMGGFGYVLQSFSFLTAVKYASAGLVALLLYLYPMFVFILSVLVFREKVTWLKVAAIILALIGTALTVDPAGGQLIGILLAILSALLYSIYIIVGTNVMKHVSAVQSSLVIFASAGVVYGVLTAINGAHLPTTDFGWMGIIGMAIVATVIPIATFLAGLERVGPTNASMLSTFEPVVTLLLAALIFGERLPVIAILGGLLILAGVVLLTRGGVKRISTARSFADE